ncbi:MAG: hypothetical protein IPO58_23165 [Betaproteobacteria bacterium]|nr:hypothetical protein [Betaproteobacteria bacterium]MBK9609175.1 hypothetical protein [Betaproteobacteria bacterium]
MHAELAMRPLDAPGLLREIFVIRRNDRSLSIAAQTMLEFLMVRKPGISARANKGTGALRGC